MKQFAFPKAEHLCLRSDIGHLFSSGSKSVTAYPVKVVYRALPLGENSPAVKVLLSVSKRRLHHAVSRNRAKRQLREAYRLNKQILYSALPEGIALHVCFIWLPCKAIPSSVVHPSVIKALGLIAGKLQSDESSIAPNQNAQNI